MLRCNYCDRVLKVVQHSEHMTVLECPAAVDSGASNVRQPMVHDAITLFDPKQEIAAKHS